MDNPNGGDSPQPPALQPLPTPPPQPLLPPQPPQTSGGSVKGKRTIAVVVGEGGSKRTEIAWPRSSRCKDKTKTVHLMEEEEGAMTKVDVVWPREIALQRNDSCLCLIRIEAAKLVQAGFRDTSWLTLV